MRKVALLWTARVNCLVCENVDQGVTICRGAEQARLGVCVDCIEMLEQAMYNDGAEYVPVKPRLRVVQ